VSEHIGLSLNGRTVRAIAVRDEAPVWSSEREQGDEESLRVAIAAVLDTVPRRRWKSPKVYAALGPARVQVKALSGLPPVANESDLKNLVRESAARFFLVNGSPPITAVSATTPDGAVLAAGFDRETVAAITGACADARCSLVAVVPSAAVLPAALCGDSAVWSDERVSVEIVFSGAALKGVRRANGNVPLEAALEPNELLSRLGDRCSRFADAYGAARAGAESPLAIRPRETGRGKVPKWRQTSAYGGLALAGLFALLAPGIRATLAAAEAEGLLSENVGSYREAIHAENELRRVSGALEEVACFAASRFSALLVLGEITRRLPTPGALLALTLEDAGGNLVYLVPDGSAPLEWLEAVTSISNAEIVGPITRELVGESTMARVTVSFLLASQARTTRLPEVPLR